VILPISGVHQGTLNALRFTQALLSKPGITVTDVPYQVR